MSEKKQRTPYAALLGDVVGSRSYPDRRALHEQVQAALTEVNSHVPAHDPLRVTTGDEFQGVYVGVGAALLAAMRVRLLLLPDTDTRFGIGWGSITVLDAKVGTQDGPAWWAARDAVETTAQEQPAARELRTTYQPAEDAGGPAPEAVNAALLCRDQMVGWLDERSIRILGGLMTGATQRELALAEGISPSAVSQRVRTDGLGAIHTATDWLGRLA